MDGWLDFASECQTAWRPSDHPLSDVQGRTVEVRGAPDMFGHKPSMSRQRFAAICDWLTDGKDRRTWWEVLRRSLKSPFHVPPPARLKSSWNYELQRRTDVSRPGCFFLLSSNLLWRRAVSSGWTFPLKYQLCHIFQRHFMTLKALKSGRAGATIRCQWCTSSSSAGASLRRAADLSATTRKSAWFSPWPAHKNYPLVVGKKMILRQVCKIIGSTGQDVDF